MGLLTLFSIPVPVIGWFLCGRKMVNSEVVMGLTGAFDVYSKSVDSRGFFFFFFWFIWLRQKI